MTATISKESLLRLASQPNGVVISTENQELFAEAYLLFQRGILKCEGLSENQIPVRGWFCFKYGEPVQLEFNFEGAS